jgi:protection-of-telomeres protein 1
MSPSLPSGFRAIRDATVAGTAVNLIGVIVAIKPKQATKKNSWVLEFTIQDDFTTGSIGSASSIICRVFRKAPEHFPNMAVRDIALLRNFRLDAWNDRVDCIFDNSRSGLLIFPVSRIPVPELSDEYQLPNKFLPGISAVTGTKDPTMHEQLAVIQLKHVASGSLQQVQQYAAATPLKPATRDRLSLIKDLQIASYYDVRAQVVNTYYNDFQGTVELKVTDYTSNQALNLYVEPDDEDAPYQDSKAWKGPYGQLTLDVRLYGPNGDWARQHVTNGDYIFLRNMHSKMSPALKLEGALHEDKQRPTKVDISKLINQTHINEIKARCKAYEERRPQESAFDALKSDPEKKSAKASSTKKAEKRAKQRAQKEQEQREIQENFEKSEAERSGVNLNSKSASRVSAVFTLTNVVRAAFPEIQHSTVSEIIYNPNLQTQTRKYNDITFPFLNCKHRTRVRVVVFFTPDLELFTHCTNDPSWTDALKDQKSKWEWGFVLLLEDAKIPRNTVSEKLRVAVGNDAAQHLLNMNACEYGHHVVVFDQDFANLN